MCDLFVIYRMCLFFQDFVCGREPGLTEDLNQILTDLTMLNKAENAKVQVL